MASNNRGENQGRGFAGMDPERQREIASEGGKSSRSGQGNQGSSQGGQRGQGSERGFASMDPERQREIASEGGRAAHQSGNAHEFTSEEAREAGRKGGAASRGNQGGSERGGNTRGGSSEQHAEAGRQSRKNS